MDSVASQFGFFLPRGATSHSESKVERPFANSTRSYTLSDFSRTD